VSRTLAAVGLRSRLVDLLSRGEEPERDPDEPVELGVVFLPEGPLTVEALRDAGIEATMLEAFDAPTAQARARIMVPRRQVAAAADILAQRAD
jgi:hypothetical protein